MPPKKNTSKHKQRARITESQHKSLPIVICNELIFSKNEDQTVPYAVAVMAQSAFGIKDRLKSCSHIRWVWSGKAWITVVRTKKMFELAFAAVAEAAQAEKVALDDQRTPWTPTNIYMALDVFEDLNGVLCVSLNGHTWVHRELIKKHDGKYHKASKTWECNPSAIKALVPLLIAEGVPLYGNFNAESVYTDALTRAGYKRAVVPDELALEDDAEAFVCV